MPVGQIRSPPVFVSLQVETGVYIIKCEMQKRLLVFQQEQLLKKLGTLSLDLYSVAFYSRNLLTSNLTHELVAQ